MGLWRKQVPAHLILVILLVLSQSRLPLQMMMPRPEQTPRRLKSQKFPTSPPTANANGPYDCQQGEAITLSSAGSNDPDGTIVSYDWSFGGTGPSPSYSCDTIGNFTISLTVTDDDGATDTSASTTITVSEVPNEPPTANANGPYECQEGDSITLSSVGSNDPDGTIVSYDWSFGGDWLEPFIFLWTRLATSRSPSQ